MTSPTGAEAGIGVGATLLGILFPPAAPFIALAGAAAGAGVSAYGAAQSGKAQQNMFNYQSRVAQINAGIAQEQGTADIMVGDIQAQRSGIATGQRMGETRAGIAAGNLSIGTGSAKQVLGSEAEVGQFEQNSIRSTAQRQAYTRQVSAFGDTAQAAVDVAAGQGARQAADFGVASSILGGATQVSDKWVKFRETGAFGGSPPYFGNVGGTGGDFGGLY